LPLDLYLTSEVFQFHFADIPQKKIQPAAESGEFGGVTLGPIRALNLAPSFSVYIILDASFKKSIKK
jgi:hypothetical protein